ncbi:hypothetical protein, partial [Leclercia adecarboxylata]|uniref:hypothetical protein n=1 Tax=Leclercia adecarboxylata TaxID=83655 RepID=UPI00234C42AD
MARRTIGLADANEAAGKTPQAGKAAIFRETGRRFQRQCTLSHFDQQTLDALEASRQLVAAPTTLAFV